MKPPRFAKFGLIGFLLIAVVTGVVRIFQPAPQPNSLFNSVVKEAEFVTPVIPKFEPLSSSVTIKTQEQSDARDRAIQLSKEMGEQIAQGERLVERLGDVKLKFKTCDQGLSVSKADCTTAKADFLQIQSESIRLSQNVEETVAKIQGEFCIIDPSRSGC
ncbi:hypothetical protein [Nostoc sp.]|uniref:hypothetical protein n=1 Tax=Nostoc sp. TaxID=1180 RepID=UPI002FF275A5